MSLFSFSGNSFSAPQKAVRSSQNYILPYLCIGGERKSTIQDPQHILRISSDWRGSGTCPCLTSSCGWEWDVLIDRHTFYHLPAKHMDPQTERGTGGRGEWGWERHPQMSLNTVLVFSTKHRRQALNCTMTVGCLKTPAFPMDT